MLSKYAYKLALNLRESIGNKSVGIGPDRNGLVALWNNEPPEALVPAIDELSNHGFISVEQVISIPQDPSMKEYGLEGIAGVIVLESLQQYFDDLI